MFERILVPLDGSELAASVMTQVRRVLTHRDAEVLLLRVVTMPPSPEADAGEPFDVLRSRARDYVSTLAATLASQGVRARGRVVEGFAASEILEAARTERATLIAMSTHGRTGIPRWVFGSVTEKILRASPVPVLAVPSFAGAAGDVFPTGPRELPFRKIVVPIADADLSLEIVPPLTEFARLFDSRVFLVHVCPAPGTPAAVHQMRMAFERLREEGIPAEPIVREGDAASRILDAAREIGADLIAMTTHGRSGVSRWAMGSVAEKVLRASNIPLLVVRPAVAPPAPAPARVEMPAVFHSDP